MYRITRPEAMPRGLTAFLVKSLICALMMAILVLTLGVLPVLPIGKLARLAWYALRCLLGFGIYLLTAIALVMPEPLKLIEIFKGIGKQRSE
jgi:hypothetical protein